MLLMHHHTWLENNFIKKNENLRSSVKYDPSFSGGQFLLSTSPAVVSIIFRLDERLEAKAIHPLLRGWQRVCQDYSCPKSSRRNVLSN